MRLLPASWIRDDSYFLFWRLEECKVKYDALNELCSGPVTQPAVDSDSCSVWLNSWLSDTHPMSISTFAYVRTFALEIYIPAILAKKCHDFFNFRGQVELSAWHRGDDLTIVDLDTHTKQHSSNFNPGPRIWLYGYNYHSPSILCLLVRLWRKRLFKSEHIKCQIPLRSKLLRLLGKDYGLSH